MLAWGWFFLFLVNPEIAGLRSSYGEWPRPGSREPSHTPQELFWDFRPRFR